MTRLLRANLENEGFDADNFCEYFGEWKALGAAGEFSDPYFGKDGEYTRPLRNSKRVLRHVHLSPEDDLEALAEWNRKFELGSRKTSDVCLVYTHDHTHGFLLIYIAREPNGHLLSEMRTPETARLMEGFADVAEEFQFNGNILI